MFILDKQRIGRARALFVEDRHGEPHTFVNVFDCLSAEIQTRAIVIRQQDPLPTNLNSTLQIARFFRYASFRFTELILRIEQINWMQREFKTKQGEESVFWNLFAALAIKDFHIDLGSLMDSLAPVVLQATGAFDGQGESKLPGFTDIQKKGSPRAVKFRQSIPDNVLNAIDGTDRWWSAVKQVRNTLTHREHSKIVFSGPNQGILFQIYEPHYAPIVLDHNLLWQSGKDVADFRLYSAAVFAELLSSLEELGIALTETMNMSVDGLPDSMRTGDFTYLIEPMEQLLATLSELSLE